MKIKTLPITKFLLVVMLAGGAFTMTAQPPNDLCADAIELTVFESESDAVPVDGDTRQTTDGIAANIPVCSANWYRDDVWYKFTASHTEGRIVYNIRVDFGDLASDVDGFGVALYNTCDAIPGNVPFFCANEPGDNRAIVCLDAGEEVIIRVWSVGGTADDFTEGWGTFRISAFWGESFESGDVNVLWGDEPGQGDFDEGLGDWTAVGIQCNGAPAENALWAWTQSGQGVYIFGGASVSPIKSRSFCNGAAIWDSGFLHFGEAGTAGSGACPWQDHEGALVSPVIDISAFDVDGISVLFNQSMQRFINGRHFLDYSTDGGASWTEIEINTEKTYLSTNPDTGEGYYNEEYRVPLPGAEGSANLRIRFRFAGVAYWWVIDDVRIIERECNNLAANNWFAIAPYGAWHVDQLSDFALLIDIENIGACTATGVAVDFEIRNEAGELVYTQTMGFPDIPASTLDENRLFSVCAELPEGTPVGRYFGSYEVRSDSMDFRPGDNRQEFTFTVSGDVMAMDIPGGSYFGSRPGGNYGKYRLGNHYYIPKGQGFEMCFAEIGVGNANAIADIGGDMLVYLFVWDDLNGDGDPQDNELERIAFNQYFFEPSDPNNAIYSIELLDENDPNFEPCVNLEDETHYVLVVEYIPPFSFPDDFLTILLQSSPDFQATSLAHTPIAGQGFGSACGPHYGMVLSRDDEDLFAIGSFNGGATPVIRMVLDKIVSTDPVVETNEYSVVILPNPVSDVMQVNIDFGQTMDRVVLRVTDVQGRVIMEETRSFMEQDSWIKPVSHLANGMYFLSIATESGVRTERFVVQK
jgi:hypothetical protein